MNILNLLTELSCNLLEKEELNDILKSQPDEIRIAIQSNDINKLKSCISIKQPVANEIKVTIY